MKGNLDISATLRENFKDLGWGMMFRIHKFKALSFEDALLDYIPTQPWTISGPSAQFALSIIVAFFTFSDPLKIQAVQKKISTLEKNRRTDTISKRKSLFTLI
jgi:hypothetical protein